MVKKKTKDIILDYRISGAVSLLFLFGLPYYIGHESKNPVFFGKYSTELMIVNMVYILILISSSALFFSLFSKRKKK